MRIVLRSLEARSAREAQTLLARAGVEAAALPGPFRPAPDGEDIVIIPAMAGAVAAASELARQTLTLAQAPLAVIVGLSAAAPRSGGAYPDFCDAVALDAPAKLLAGQIEACIRTAAAVDELKRRAATAAALALPAPKPAAPQQVRALYVGAPSAMFISLERAFAALGGRLEATFSAHAGLDHLHDQAFDAVILNAADKPKTALSFCAALRRNARLNPMPTMLITARGDAAIASAGIERGACAVIEAGAEAETGLAWLGEAIQRQRRRSAAGHSLSALRDLMGDARTGLFLSAPFETHLARLARDHQASGRPLGLAALRALPAHGAREPSEDVWRKGFAEVGSLAAGLMRETDCGAALGRDLIAIALPASDLAAAKRSAERIASVAECTAFAAGESGAAPLIFEQSAVELQPGESGAGLLARALRAIDVERARA